MSLPGPVPKTHLFRALRRALVFAGGWEYAPHMAIGKLRLAAFMLGLAVTASATTWSNIATYPVPIADSGPTGIAAGPDGALWFTQNGSIGRITTGGGGAEYPVPT